MSGKNLVLKLNAVMLLANQVAGFLNFNIPNTIGGIKLKLKIDDVILHEWGQACPKRLWKLLRSQRGF